MSRVESVVVVDIDAFAFVIVVVLAGDAVLCTAFVVGLIVVVGLCVVQGAEVANVVRIVDAVSDPFAIKFCGQHTIFVSSLQKTYLTMGSAFFWRMISSHRPM
jgi:hypothetical protein